MPGCADRDIGRAGGGAPTQHAQQARQADHRCGEFGRSLDRAMLTVHVQLLEPWLQEHSWLAWELLLLSGSEGCDPK